MDTQTIAKALTRALNQMAAAETLFPEDPFAAYLGQIAITDSHRSYAEQKSASFDRAIATAKGKKQRITSDGSPPVEQHASPQGFLGEAIGEDILAAVPPGYFERIVPINNQADAILTGGKGFEIKAAPDAYGKPSIAISQRELDTFSVAAYLALILPASKGTSLDRITHADAYLMNDQCRDKTPRLAGTERAFYTVRPPAFAIRKTSRE